MKKYFYLIILIVFITAGCEETLDLTVQDRPTYENFYKSPEDALIAVNGIYNVLASPYLYNSNMWLIPDIASDDHRARTSLNDPNLHQLSDFSIKPDNKYIQEIWAGSYDGINRANVVLEKVPDIVFENNGYKNRLLGEAKFIRGLLYFNLVRMFGDVPLVLKTNFSTTQLDIERTKIDVVYDTIIKDLEFAAKFLPKTYTSAEDKGRATKGAALGLLSKIYLTQGEWALAVEKAEEVMGLEVYDLHPDYISNFKESHVNGQESIFEVQFYSGDPAMQSRIVISALPIIYFFPAGVEIFLPTEDLFESFDTNDYRRDVTFFEEYFYFINNTFEPHVWKHWDQDVYGPRETGQSGANFPVLRYSEILLIYAEALAEEAQTPTQEAYDAVNLVRERARNGDDTILPDLSGLTLEQFRDAVLEERRFELVNEGHRWFDLVRTGNLVDFVNTAKGSSADPQPIHNLFPIPQRERNLNSKLTQNPGYSQ